MALTVKPNLHLKKYRLIWLLCSITIVISIAIILIIMYKTSQVAPVSQNAYTVSLPSNNGYKKDRSFEIQLYGILSEKTSTTLTLSNADYFQTVRYGKETTFQAADLSIIHEENLIIGMPIFITINTDYSSCDSEGGCELGGRLPLASIASLFIPGEIKSLKRPVYNFGGIKSGLSYYLLSTTMDGIEKVTFSLNGVTKIMYAERFSVTAVSYDEANTILTISDSGTERQLPLATDVQLFKVLSPSSDGSFESKPMSEITTGDKLIISGSIEVPLAGAMVEISDIVYSTLYLMDNENE